MGCCPARTSFKTALDKGQLITMLEEEQEKLDKNFEEEAYNIEKKQIIMKDNPQKFIDYIIRVLKEKELPKEGKDSFKNITKAIDEFFIEFYGSDEIEFSIKFNELKELLASLK
jgi:hypothetical protein